MIGDLVAAANSALAVRLWELQVVRTSEFRGQAEANRTRSVSVPTVRGLIFDRLGRQLVQNVPVFAVWISPADVPEAETRRIAEELAGLTGGSADEIELAVSLGRSQPQEPVRVARDVPRETAMIIAERPLSLPGVTIRDSSKREYAEGDVLGSIVGFTGPIPAERAAEFVSHGVRFDEDIGLDGIEKSLQDVLRGRDGRRLIEVGALGEERRELAMTEPHQGKDVHLTIDTDFQRGTHEILARYLGGSGAGVAVVMDPNNGDVLSMVSYPSYDNQSFAEGISADEFGKLNSDPRRPLINHAISGLYPPGSTYKLVSAGAALEENVVSPATTIECTGSLILPSGWVFYDWLLTGHGVVNLHRAIAESCNVYFYNISGGNPYTDFAGLGERRLALYGTRFGFGKATGIDLPNESEGVVPDSRWKSEHLDQSWVTGDTYQAAIGQGFVQASPLQIANMYAAIGNGGTLYKPRIVDRIQHLATGEIEIPSVSEIGKLPISPRNLELLRRGLVEAVNGPQGTGRRAKSSVVEVAGKTGTAEYSGVPDVEGNPPSHAWFIGYAPADFPRIAFAVLIRDGGEGSLAAAPVARDIVEFFFTGEMPPMRYIPLPPRRTAGAQG